MNSQSIQTETINQSEVMSETPPRYAGLDILKCLAAYMVVVIHFGHWDSTSELDILLGGVFNAETRFAVPVFFMITGYFYPSIIKRGRFKGHLLKIVSMTLFATLFYFCFNVLFYSLNGGNAEEYLAKVFSLRHLFGWVLINSVPVEIHLWYFYAVIYALVVLYLADRLHLQRHLYIFSLVALVVCVCVNFTPYTGYCRNFLFMGLPFICLGRLIGESKHVSFILNLSSRYLWGVFLVSIILVGLDYMFFSVVIGKTFVRECYLFTCFVALSLFVLALKYNSHPNKLERVFSLIGKKYSAYIFIFHIACGKIILCLMDANDLLSRYLVLIPLIFISSLLLAIIYVELKSVISQ